VTEETLADWQREVFPYDLGDGEHRWSWLVRANAAPGDGKDILFLHRCNGKWSTNWIDLTSGTKHQLITEDPLHIEASVACPQHCGDHGFIRDGRWVPA
jgi:hypothetical protein